MNTKTISIAVIIVVVVALGAYFAYTSMGKSAASDQQAASSTADKVQGQDVKVGTGLEAKPGDTVSVLYEGKFTNGTVFDSSAAHGNEPLTFVLGSQGLIPGFQIGVRGMKEGGRRLLAIPPAFGYGSEDVKDETGKVIIPANSTLVFEIQLEKVVPGTGAPTTQ